MKKTTLLKALTVSLGITLFGGMVAASPEQVSAATSSTSIPLDSYQFRQNIINTGLKYLGTPYQWGASKYTTSVFDCSSFTQRVFYENGVTLPRGARAQMLADNVRYVSRSNLRKGDLLFFSTTATQYNTGIKKVGHVGIYYGNGKVLHTWGEGGVRIQSFTSGWWNRHYVSARRVISRN